MAGRRDRRTADWNTNIKEPVKQALLRKRYFHNLQLTVNGLYLYYMINQAIDHYVIMAQEIDLSITTITQRLLRTIL